MDGGARRNRTADLFNAIEALSQLSYDPGHSKIARSPENRLGQTVEAWGYTRAGSRGGDIAATASHHKRNIGAWNKHINPGNFARPSELSRTEVRERL